MLNLTRDAGASLETLQALYSAGLSPIFSKRKIQRQLIAKSSAVSLASTPQCFARRWAVFETDDIVRSLCEINGFIYVNDYITQENFPLVGNRASEDEIVIHDPGCSFTEDEGLAILKQKGLQRPTYEHALRFVDQHGTATTSEKKPYVVFLHKPWLDPNRDRRILYFNRSPGHRKLYLDYVDFRFYDSCVLAGFRPRK